MENRLITLAFGVAVGVFWAACIFTVGLINLIVPSFGLTFLWFVSSISPGFNADATLLSVLIGTVYALLEGLIAGSFIAWVYNLIARIQK